MNKDDDVLMKIKYWGIRGSLPAPLTKEQVLEKQTRLLLEIIEKGGMRKVFGSRPNESKIKSVLSDFPISLSGTYGGDTTCIEVQAKDSPLIIIDTGSGARHLGNELLGRLFSGQNLNPLYSDKDGIRDLHIFFTHYHWDHIQGFPFFAPAFIPGDKKVNIKFYGKKNAKTRLSNVLKGQQEYPVFPVEWETLPCKKDYQELGRMNLATVGVGNAEIRYAELDHPDRVYGYAIELGGKKAAFASDTEHREIVDPMLVTLAQGADVLYYDAQYTPEEYRGEAGIPKVRWGHSTYEWAVRTALAANVKTVVLGHLDPARDDFGVDEIVERAHDLRDEETKSGEHKGKEVEIVPAYQGLEQVIRA